MKKGLFWIAVVFATSYFAFVQRSGQIALEAYRERDLLERQYGSACTPTGAKGGPGWSWNLDLVLNDGKGQMFPTQAECERQYQWQFGKSPKR